MELTKQARDTSSEQQEETMKILIEEAERLRRQIDEAQVHLINARLQKDEEGKKSAISEMETTMCNAMQLLKCLIERKDNIVDLSEVWHDITEPADRNGHVLLSNHPKYIEMASQGQKIWGESICKGAKYAYLKDLLPKGGE